MSFLKKYWIEIFVFSVVATVLFIDIAPDITWMNTDSDGAHYTLAAKYLWVAHNTSAPLFLLIGHLFIKFIPFGTDAWRFGSLLALSTVVTSIFIYLIAMRLLNGKNKSRLYALIASIIYGGSALVISQSIIIDTYAFDTMLIVIAYYFILRKQFIWTTVFMGLCLATHPLMFGLAYFVMFVAHKELRNWKMIALTASFVLFYLYIPISKAFNGALDMWGNTTIVSFFINNWGTLSMLTGTLSVWDFPQRFLNTVGILGVSLGLGLVVIAIYFIKRRTVKYELFWLVMIYLLYFVTDLANETYVYIMPSIAFGAVIVAIGISQMNKYWTYAVLITSCGLMLFNANYFDIGRTLDPEMSAMKFYNEELAKIPDGQIFMGGGWNWAMVYLYNQEEGRKIIPICTDVLTSDIYTDLLLSRGIKLDKYDTGERVNDEIMIELSIAKNNENVWIAKPTKPEVYQYVIEPAKGNEVYIAELFGVTRTTEWRWKPSNPYSFITGSLEIEYWSLVLCSNYNVIYFITVIMLALMANSYMWKWLDKRKKRLLYGDIPNIQT
jgi:hypothetical protein